MEMAKKRGTLTSYQTRDEIEAQSAAPMARDAVIREAGSEFDRGGKLMKGLTKRQFVDASLKHEGGLPKLADTEAAGMEHATRRTYNRQTARWEYK